MREYIINTNDSGQRLDKFLLKAVPKLPKGLMCKYVRLKRIKLNGKRCEISDKLNDGDILQLYINDEFFEPTKKAEHSFLNAPPLREIIYEDENLIIINKSSGMIVHSDNQNEGDTLIDSVKKYLHEKNEYNPENEASFSPALCNRLDRNTCGLIIAAKNAQALRDINEKIRTREIHKKYLCVCCGTPTKLNDTAKAYLYKNCEKNTVTVSENPLDDYKEIITAYRVIKQNGELSLIEVELITGRTHQIRAHLAYLEAPILGDSKYGSAPKNRQYKIWGQCLCAYRLEFKLLSSCSLDSLNGRSFEVPEFPFRSLIEK